MYPVTSRCIQVYPGVQLYPGVSRCIQVYPGVLQVYPGVQVSVLIGVCFSAGLSEESSGGHLRGAERWSAEFLLYSVFNVYTDTYLYIYTYIYMYICVGTYMYKDGLRVHVTCSGLATFLYWLFWYWFLYWLFCALKSL